MSFLALPNPHRSWPAFVERLQRTPEEPWDHDFAVADLRYWVDARRFELKSQPDRDSRWEPSHAELTQTQRDERPGAGIPGRRTLAKRWGWTPHEVRKLMADWRAWWDSGRFGPQVKAQLSLHSPTPRPVVAQSSPTPNETTPATAEDSPTSRPVVAQSSPSARGGSPDHPITDRTPVSPSRGTNPPARVAWLRDVAHAALVADHAAGQVVEPYVAAWEAGAIAHVRGWLMRCKPRKDGKRVLPALLPDAPASMRQRDAAEGLRLAAELWRNTVTGMTKASPETAYFADLPEFGDTDTDTDTDPPPPVARPPPIPDGPSDRARAMAEGARQRLQQRREQA